MSSPVVSPQAPLTRPVSSLAMIGTLALVSALAGLLVVMAFEITKPMIEENQRRAIEQALAEILPAAVSRRDFIVTGDSLLPLEADTQLSGERIYAGYDQADQRVGLGLAEDVRVFGVGVTQNQAMHDEIGDVHQNAAGKTRPENLHPVHVLSFPPRIED